VNPQILSTERIASCPTLNSAIGLFLGGGLPVITPSRPRPVQEENSSDLHPLNLTLASLTDLQLLENAPLVRQPATNASPEINFIEPLASEADAFVATTPSDASVDEDHEFAGPIRYQSSRGRSISPEHVEDFAERQQGWLFQECAPNERSSEDDGRSLDDAAQQHHLAPSVRSASRFLEENDILPNIPQKRPSYQDKGSRSKLAKLNISGKRQGTAGILAEYLSLEEERCRKKGLPGPKDTFFQVDIQTKVTDLEKGGKGHLAIILVGLACSESIATLQGMVRRVRNGTGNSFNYPAETISFAQRYSAIETLDRQVAYYSFLRRHHILRLFEESGGTLTGSIQRIVINSAQSYQQIAKRSGNPRNKAEAEVTKKMMQEIFPSVVYGTTEYQSRYRKVTKLRKLGQRFHMITSRFGQGILGLIPHHSLTGEFDVGISDDMYVELRNSGERRS
jgi:hypothetical protein